VRPCVPLLVVVSLAAACARSGPPPASPAATSPDFEVREVTLENGWLFTKLEIPRTPAGRKPAVVVLGGKGAPLRYAGIIVVTFRQNWASLKALEAPQRPPGEPPPPPPQNTVGSWLLAAPTAKTVGQGYFQLITSQAHDLSRVVDYLLTLPEVDRTRIGVMGLSTSGFVTLQAVAYDERLSAAAVVASCGDYLQLLHESNLAMGGKPLDLDPTYERWLRDEEPIRHPARLTHAALLMVNGDADLTVPRSCIERTAQTLQRAYARAGVPERFRFVMFAGEGHTLSDSAQYEVLAWWYRWFVRRPAEDRPDADAPRLL